MSLEGRRKKKYIYKSKLFHKRKIKIQLLAVFTYRTKIPGCRCGSQGGSYHLLQKSQKHR